MKWPPTRSMRTWTAAALVVCAAVAWGGGPGDRVRATANAAIANPAVDGTTTTTTPTGPTTSSATTTTVEATGTTEVAATPAPADRDDGVLTIGTLLPDTGPGNQIGIAANTAVNSGVREINERGGVLGQPVRWFHASEGETVDEALAGIDALRANGVDAIIGPASSIVTLSVLGDLLDEGLLVCSPTATALALNDFPDRERFFRTVPSDSLSAQTLAEVARNTGVDTYAVVYLDDEYGRPFAEQAMSRLAGPEVADLSDHPFPSDATPEQLIDIATELAERAPRTIVLIADSEHGWPMLQAISTVFTSSPPSIIVNDAMREPPNREIVAALDPEFRERIVGISPVVPPDPGEPVGAYATNALDCLNLIALATIEAGTDDPEAIAAEMVDVSVVGALCNTFAACSNRADDNLNLNYQGPNSIALSSRGDPAHGRFGVFVFDASGLDVSTGGFLQITEQTD